jgi:hypothetical protein
MGLSKMLQYGFLVFVFLLPFQTVFLLREPFEYGEKWQYGTIGVYAIDILLVTLLAFIFIKWLRDCSKKYQVSRISYAVSRITRHLSLILLLVWAGISVFWAPDHLLAGYFFLKLLLGAGLFFVTRSFDPSVIKKVVFTLLLAGVLQSGIGIAQFLSQQSFESTVLGMSAHEAWQAGSSVLKIDGEPASPSLGGRFLRAYGTFPHPNMLGGFLAVIFVSGMAYLVLGIKELEKKEGSKYHLSLILHPLSFLILYLSSLIIILLGLILTFSRTAWMGAGLGIGALFLWSFFSSDTRKLRPWFSSLPLAMLGVLACAGIVFVSVLQAQIFPRFDRATIAREGSVSERVLSLYDAKTVMDATPLLFGTGAGNFTETLLRLEGSRPVWTLQPVHNVVVLILAEIGAIGLFLWFLFLGTIFVSWKKYLTSQRKESVRVIFGIALVVLLPSLFLDHWLWTSHFGLFFVFLFLGLSQSKNESGIN